MSTQLSDWPFLDHQSGDAILPEEPATIFEAVIVPHQSLGRRGSIILIAGLTILSAGISLRFLFMGAWPVLAFSAIEIPLAVFLLLLSRHRAKAREFIQLNAAEIKVVQTDPSGRRRGFSLPSAPGNSHGLSSPARMTWNSRM